MCNLSLQETADRITEAELDFMYGLTTEEEHNEEILKLNDPWKKLNIQISKQKKQIGII